VVEAFDEIIDVCRKFAKKEIAPMALEADLTPGPDWVKSIWIKGQEIGIPRVLIPEDFGGVNQSDLCCALILDVLASECAGVASVFAHHFAGCAAIMAGGQEQKEKYLLPLCNVANDDPEIVTVIFPSHMEEAPLRLKEKEGKLILTGTSDLVGNAGLAKTLCVFVEENGKGKEVTCVLAQRDAPGICLGERAKLPGLKVNPFAPIIFQDVEIDSKAIIGLRFDGRQIMETTNDFFYGLVSAVAIGTARRAYEKALAYAKERYQFGKIIIHHPEIQRMLGSMLMKLKIGGTAYIQLLNGEQRSFRSSDACLAKAFCTKASLEIVIDAVQIHGGYGYMHEYGIEKIMRDSKVLELLGGSNPWLHIQAIAKDI
jgi:alkylation response protein AidB-like acyl-CoA dehydrogenase